MNVPARRPPGADLADRLAGLNREDRPTERFDAGLQHERTALAWERTAIAMMVAGVVFVRYGATHQSLVLAITGLAQITFGSVILVWAGVHYEELHGVLRSGDSPLHPTMTKVIGLSTVALAAIALAAALATLT